MSIDVAALDRIWERSLMQEELPESGTYLFPMPTSPDARHARFGKFVRGALDAGMNRGLTIKQIEERTRVSKTTFYRWRDGQWTREPERLQVVAFCTGLDRSPEEAFAALGWDQRREPTPPPPMERDFEILLRRLADPTVPDREKFHIRETIASLASRIPGRRSTGGNTDRSA